MEYKNNFVITTDATCDLPKTYIDEKKLSVLSLGFTLEGVDYKGEQIKNLDYQEFYNKMRGGAVPQTVQVTPDEAEMVFEGYLKEGMDIIHIAFSSALSGSCNSANIAMNELKEKYPDRKMVVIDSLCASLGEGLLVYNAIKLMETGATYESVVAYVEDNKLHICHNFTVDDLIYLHRGGRVSKTAAIVGSLLGVKPVLHVDNNGKLVPLSKVRGRKQSLVALVDNMAQKIGSMKNEVVFISHGDCMDDVEIVKSFVTEKFGIKNFVVNFVGPVIGSHSGPGTMALFFMGESRE